MLLRKGKKQKKIALLLGRNKSTISRELKRNGHHRLYEYLPDTAEKKACQRKARGRKKRYLDKEPELKEYVLEKLRLGWSPEQIEGRMRMEIGWYLNYESIYQYLYLARAGKENLKQYLRRAHRLRQKKHGRKHQKGKIPNRVDISLRPKVVEKRRQFGHWEGNSIFFQGRSQSLATLTERKTRFIIILRTRDRTAEERAKIIKEKFSQLPAETRKTMTFDNGLEFAHHRLITKTREKINHLFCLIKRVSQISFRNIDSVEVHIEKFLSQINGISSFYHR